MRKVGKLVSPLDGAVSSSSEKLENSPPPPTPQSEYHAGGVRWWVLVFGTSWSGIKPTASGQTLYHWALLHWNICHKNNFFFVLFLMIRFLMVSLRFCLLCHSTEGDEWGLSRHSGSSFRIPTSSHGKRRHQPDAQLKNFCMHVTVIISTQCDRLQHPGNKAAIIPNTDWTNSLSLFTLLHQYGISLFLNKYQCIVCKSAQAWPFSKVFNLLCEKVPAVVWALLSHG